MSFKDKMAAKVVDKTVGVTNAPIVQTTQFVTILDGHPEGSYYANWEAYNRVRVPRRRQSYFESAFFTNTTDTFLAGVIKLFERFRVQVIVNLQGLDTNGIRCSNLIELATAHADEYHLAQRLHSMWYFTHTEDEKAAGIVHDDLFAHYERSERYGAVEEATIDELKAREAAANGSQFIRALVSVEVKAEAEAESKVQKFVDDLDLIDDENDGLVFNLDGLRNTVDFIDGGENNLELFGNYKINKINKNIDG